MSIWGILRIELGSIPPVSFAWRRWLWLRSWGAAISSICRASGDGLIKMSNVRLAGLKLCWRTRDKGLRSRSRGLLKIRLSNRGQGTRGCFRDSNRIKPMEEPTGRLHPDLELDKTPQRLQWTKEMNFSEAWLKLERRPHILSRRNWKRFPKKNKK